MDWFDLLTVQGTQESPTPQLKSISSSALILRYGPALSFRSDFSALGLDVTSSRQLLKFSVALQLSGLPPAQLWSLSLAVTSP